MTEKRFTLKEEMDYSVLLLDNGKRLYTNEVVELLNAQHEEIERLRKENRELEKFRYAVFKNLHMMTENKDEHIGWKRGYE